MKPKEFKPLTCEELLELNDNTREMLSMLAAIMKRWSGSSSPAEEFIWQVVRCHARCSDLTPDDVQDYLKEFRENFDDEISEARALLKQYPDLILAGKRLSMNEQIKALQEINNDEQQQAFHLEDARNGLRAFPSLLLAEEIDEPWKGALDDHYAESGETPKAKQG